MLRKIAIIGANGFVGRRILAEASSRGIEAVGVVRSEAGVEIVRSLGGVPARVADLQRSQTESLVPLLSGCAGIVYTASITTSSAASDRTEPSGIVNVLAAARQAGVRSMVFFSGLGIAHYGISPHCTNSYFLAKMTGEVALFRSPLDATVFRPSYIFGHGDEFLTPLIGRMLVEPAIEMPGDGAYRLQPISVEDAARAAIAALNPGESSPRVLDLVGPEILSYRSLISRISGSMGRSIEIRERPVEEAIAIARASGYFGLRPHDLDCLLCDEVADARPTAKLVGSPLEDLDSVIGRAIAAGRKAGAPAGS